MTDATDPSTPASVARVRGMEPDDWHVDLDALADGIVERHRQPFHSITAAKFRATVDGAHEGIRGATPAAALVGLDEVAAAIGDGHTTVETGDHYRRSPLSFFWYDDELRAVNAPADNNRVRGARLVAINGTAVDEVDRNLQRLIPHGENAWYERSRSADLFAQTDVLVGLGVLPDSGVGLCSFVDRDGKAFAEQVEPLPVGVRPAWPSPSADGPLRLRGRDGALAFTSIPGTDAVYANFRRYDGLEPAASRLLDHLRESGARRLILDLRDNEGGDYTLARHLLIYPLWSLPGINRPGGLYVLIGRRTFSAAMVTATDFRRETEALLVGEPTGARPTGYQESGTFVLPRSGIRAHCAIRHYRFSDADTPAVVPDRRVDPQWRSDMEVHDAAIAWCLAPTQRRGTEHSGTPSAM